AQDIPISDLYEIVNCGQDCYEKIVNVHSLIRLDGMEGSKMSNNGHGHFLKYGPPVYNTANKINSLIYFTGSNRVMAIIYTNYKEYWMKFYDMISTSNKYIRVPDEEGSTEYRDWIYMPVG